MRTEIEGRNEVKENNEAHNINHIMLQKLCRAVMVFKTHHKVVGLEQLTGIAASGHGERLRKFSREIPVHICHSNKATAPAVIQGLCVCGWNEL